MPLPRTPCSGVRPIQRTRARTPPVQQSQRDRCRPVRQAAPDLQRSLAPHGVQQRRKLSCCACMRRASVRSLRPTPASAGFGTRGHAARTARRRSGRAAPAPVRRPRAAPARRRAILVVQARQLPIGLGQGRIQQRVVQHNAAGCHISNATRRQGLAVACQLTHAWLAELHLQRAHGLPGYAARAYHRRQHGLDLVRAERQRALARVVNHQPACAPAITGSATPSLIRRWYYCTTRSPAQAGRGLHRVAHHVEAARPHQRPGLEAGRVVRCGRTPQPRDSGQWASARAPALPGPCPPAPAGARATRRHARPPPARCSPSSSTHWPVSQNRWPLKSIKIPKGDPQRAAQAPQREATAWQSNIPTPSSWRRSGGDIISRAGATAARANAVTLVDHVKHPERLGGLACGRWRHGLVSVPLQAR